LNLIFLDKIVGSSRLNPSSSQVVQVKTPSTPAVDSLNSPLWYNTEHWSSSYSDFLKATDVTNQMDQNRLDVDCNIYEEMLPAVVEPKIQIKQATEPFASATGVISKQPTSTLKRARGAAVAAAISAAVSKPLQSNNIQDQDFEEIKEKLIKMEKTAENLSMKQKKYQKVDCIYLFTFVLLLFFIFICLFVFNMDLQNRMIANNLNKTNSLQIRMGVLEQNMINLSYCFNRELFFAYRCLLSDNYNFTCANPESYF
jgi:hypothetical protein